MQPYNTARPHGLVRYRTEIYPPPKKKAFNAQIYICCIIALEPKNIYAFCQGYEYLTDHP